jgi:hypothetical protein
MLRLYSIPTEPYWLKILEGGVRFLVLPPTTDLCAEAEAIALRTIRAVSDNYAERKKIGALNLGERDPADPAVSAGLVRRARATAYGQAAIKEWEGLLPKEGTEPLPVTDENIAEAMRIDTLSYNFMERYLKSLDKIVIEGNVSGSAPNGTGAADPDTARGAEQAKLPVQAEG